MNLPAHPIARRSVGGRKAFTLIELLVVISIIAVLASILMPSVKMVRESAKTLKCKSNLRQIMLSIQGYGNDWDGRLVSFNNGTGRWFANLASYLDAKRTGQDWQVQGDLTKFNSVVWGCPVYNVDMAKKGATDYDWRPGYGLSSKPALPENADHSDWAQSGARDFFLLELHHPAQRMLSSDTCDWHFEGQWSGSKPIWYKDGDFARNDPKRHRGKANYGFVDAHVSTLGPDRTALGYLDPAKFSE